jgi:twitching motility protein PilT
VLATMHSATATEAVGRICMSFPAEIQGSIRAQLADCLVGVLCQRLDYLSHRKALVPRCELLLGTSSAKGTIRSGNFSHLGNVIQTSGEEGMWSFDRYARWLDEHSDGPRSLPGLTNPAQPRGSERGPTDGDRASAGPRDEDMDMAELAELVDQLERRSP